MVKGKLIVIEGIDGSGKGSVVRSIKTKLEKDGVKVGVVDFPRYDHFFGKLTRIYLNGGFGSLEKINPYVSMWLYALDRWGGKKKINQYLKKGYLVLCDRYVPSSLAHQSSRLSPSKRGKFIKWVEKVEYSCLGLPREDLVVLIEIPFLKAIKFATSRSQKSDKVDTDKKHQKSSADMYLKLVKKHDHWEMVKSVNKNGKILSIDQIGKLILKRIKAKKII